MEYWNVLEERDQTSHVVFELKRNPKYQVIVSAPQILITFSISDLIPQEAEELKSALREGSIKNYLLDRKDR